MDGTLLDTLRDLADSANAALEQLGFPRHPYDAYRYFIGKGTDGMVKQIIPEGNRDEQTLDKCLKIAKEQYSRRWKCNSKPYPGVPELLDSLEERNFTKVVFSNKPDEFTQVMVKELLADWSFEIVMGVCEGVPKKPEPTAALQIAKELNIATEKFIYLGDSNTDMQTATAAGMYPVGALWGYRDAEELLDSGAKMLAENPLDILDLLEKTSK